MKVLLLVLLLFLCYNVLCAENNIDIIVDDECNYKVIINNESWFTSSSTVLRANGKAYSSHDKTLLLNKKHSFKGNDAIGSYDAIECDWMSIDNNPMVTTFKQYTNNIVFSQYFPHDIYNATTNDIDNVITQFPSFHIYDLNASPRGALAYNGQMVGELTVAMPWGNQTSLLPYGMDGTGPITVFQRDLKASCVISAYSNFMAANQYYDKNNNVLQFGIMGNVSYIPKNYLIEFMIHNNGGGGINSQMMSWGETLRNVYGKAAYTYDFTTTHLGYSTDNGAFYYYNTEKSKNYQQTIEDIKDYADKVNIPYRHILLDSWWYYKGTSDGVKEWLPMPNIFPGGMDTVYNYTKWPIVGHNRYWANNNVYAKQNGGKWNFIIEGDFALPVDQEFWNWLMISSRQWGLRVYEQDWLDFNMVNVKSLNSNCTLGRTWLLQMGKACELAGIQQQYCMSYSRHILQSLEIPTVTQARASDDYHSGLTDQWNIGTTSIFAIAMGLTPTKDNFWSKEVQTGNPYANNRTEPYSKLQAVVSVLSAGPVAPSDGIGQSDRDLIMKTCTAHGVLLQPDHPCTAIDAMFLGQVFGSQYGPQGQVWSTTSTINGLSASYLHVLAVNMSADFNLNGEDLNLSPTTSYVYWDSQSEQMEVNKFTGSLNVPICGKSDFHLYHFVPINTIGLYTLMGELEKFVPTSNKRFIQVDTTTAVITVQAVGSESETISVAFLNHQSFKVEMATCTFNASGFVKIQMPGALCI